MGYVYPIFFAEVLEISEHNNIEGGYEIEYSNMV